MDEDNLISDCADLYRLETDSWLTIKLLAGMTWNEWDKFAIIKYPGWNVVGLNLADDIADEQEKI